MVKTKLLKRSVPAWTIIVAAILAVTITFAAVQYSLDLVNQMKLEADYRIALFEEDGVTPLTSITWPNFVGGDTQMYNFKIKNIGNVKVDVSWNSSDFPDTEWNIALFLGGSMTPWAENALSHTHLAVGVSMPARINLTEVAANPSQQYGFTLSLYSHDVPP